MYEKLIEYKLELLRNEKIEKKRDQIEIDIFELIHTIEELMAWMCDIKTNTDEKRPDWFFGRALRPYIDHIFGILWPAGWDGWHKKSHAL